MVVVALFLMSCGRTNFTVKSYPIRPEDVPKVTVNNADIPVSVQIANFKIRKVDTQYTKKIRRFSRNSIQFIYQTYCLII